MAAHDDDGSEGLDDCLTWQKVDNAIYIIVVTHVTTEIIIPPTTKLSHTSTHVFFQASPLYTLSTESATSPFALIFDDSTTYRNHYACWPRPGGEAHTSSPQLATVVN